MSMTMIANEHPVARKEHECSLCHRTIQPGERYNRQRSVGDDGPYVFKDCAHCEAMVKILNDDEGDWYDTWEGFTAWDVAELEPTSIRTARLKVMYHRRWRRRDGALYPVPDVVLPPAQQPPTTDGTDQ